MTTTHGHTIRMLLKYHCVAEVQVDEDERTPYVPPPVQHGEHHAQCGCRDCSKAKAIAAGIPFTLR